MTYVNIPANLRDMWMGLTDRIAKLENAPDGAQDSADLANQTANAAYAQSLVAAQAANQAALQAGVALQSANGKNQVHYSTSAPGSATGQNGDIWFQTDSSFNVQYQYVYNAGGWQNSPITNTVIASLDAGKITTGTLTSIAIYAGSSGQFQVSAAGALSATNASIQGTVTAAAGTIGGWTITGNGLSSSSNGSYLYNNGTLFVSSTISAGGTITASGMVQAVSGMSTNSGGTSTFNGQIFAVGNRTGTSSAANGYFNSSTGYFTYSTASSQRYKNSIVDLDSIQSLSSEAILKLRPRAFKYNDDYLQPNDQRYQQIVPGFISEEIYDVLPIAVDIQDGKIENWNERMLIPGIVSLLQQYEKRITALETK